MYSLNVFSFVSGKRAHAIRHYMIEENICRGYFGNTDSHMSMFYDFNANANKPNIKA